MIVAISDEFEVAAEEGFLPGILDHRPFRLDLLEDRRLAELQADPDRDRDQQERHQERYAPPICVEGLSAEIGAAADDHGERDHDAERRRGLQPAGVVAAILVRDMLGDVGDGAAVLAAQAQTLDHAHAEQQEGGRDADLVECGNEADATGADAHAGERYKKGVLAADAVAQPSKQERPKWTDQEAGGEQRDRAQKRCDRVALFKELDRQNRGQAAENIEVIPLDDVSHRRGNDHASKIFRNFWPSHLVVSPISTLHLQALSFRGTRRERRAMVGKDRSRAIRRPCRTSGQR